MSVRRWRVVARLISRVMPGLVLSGCIAFQPMPPRDATPTAQIGRWVAIAPDQAHVRLPVAGAPAILAGRERRNADGRLVQELTLANATVAPGTNLLALALDPRGGLFGSGLFGGAVGTLPYAVRTEDISRVAQERLTGAEIAGPPATRSNRYGPYAYVTASYPGGVRCVLAWQAVGPEAAAMLPASARQAAVQLRYCAAGRSTDELLQVFDTLTLPS